MPKNNPETPEQQNSITNPDKFSISLNGIVALTCTALCIGFPYFMIKHGDRFYPNDPPLKTDSNSPYANQTTQDLCELLKKHQGNDRILLPFFDMSECLAYPTQEESPSQIETPPENEGVLTPLAGEWLHHATHTAHTTYVRLSSFVLRHIND